MIPKPLPDELYVGYLGRLLMLNGKKATSAYDCLNILKKYFPEVNAIQDSFRSTENALALIFDVKEDELFNKYSLLPLRNFVKNNEKNLKTRSPRVSDLRKGNKDFHFCEQCISEDKSQFGFSYWRRQHQISGSYWCYRHQTPLKKVKHRSPYLRFPEHWLLVNNASAAAPTELCINSFIEKYLRMSSEILRENISLTADEVKKVVMHRAEVRGFTKKKINYGFLDYEIQNSFGEHWIKLNAPRIANYLLSGNGNFSNKRNDHILKYCSSSSAEYLIITVSLLFDDCSDLESEVANIYCDEKKKKKNSGNLKKYDKLLHGAYIEHNGNLEDISRKLDLPEGMVKNKLIEKGLIPFGEDTWGGDFLRALYAFLIGKKDLAQSAAIGGLSIDSFTELLRSMSTPMVKALEHMQLNQKEELG